jgi:putative endonuclease
MLAQGRPFDTPTKPSLTFSQERVEWVPRMHLTVFKIGAVKRDDLTGLPSLEPPPVVFGHAFVYILVCSDGALYVGSAGDLAVRLRQHGGSQGVKFTRDHPGGRLVYFEGPLAIAVALQRERQLKRWSRAKKLALIQNKTAVLRRLSQSRERHRQ